MTSKPQSDVGFDAKKVPQEYTEKWYRKEVNLQFRPEARELLENYSKIPADEVESHVSTIRDKAWEIHPYPCLGQFRFLDLSVTLSPHYPTILSRLKNNHETYLDLGCCFGQDIRKLVYDGVPSTQTYGCDLRTDFLDYGFDLFRDRDTLKTKFFQADVFDPNSDLNQLDGKVDILYAGSFLHLFPYSQQVEVCVRITELLADKEGSVVMGRQVGNSEAKPFESVTNPGQMILRHNAETFKKMWQEVENLTGTRWRVDVELLKRDDEAMPNQGTFTGDRALRFAVFRQTAVELE